MSDALSPEGMRTLLGLARASVFDAVLGDGRVTQALAGVDVAMELQSERGAFVSLRRPDGGTLVLRGCIGNLTAQVPLYRNVIRVAALSALNDPRFPPLAEGELDGLVVEISVLTPSRRVERPEEIEVGRHGVELKRGPARAVFLPHVATEQGWDLVQLLSRLSRKAGLPDEAWREAELHVFEAQKTEGPLSDPN